LEDLHRGLAFDAEHAEDKKRKKTLGKILDKIEEFLEPEEVGDGGFNWTSSLIDGNDRLDSELPTLPASPRDLFEEIFAPTITEPLAFDLPCTITLSQIQRQAVREMETVSGDIHRLLGDAAAEEREIALNARQLMVLTLAVQDSLGKSGGNPSTPVLEVAQRICEAMCAAANPGAASDEGDDKNDEDFERRFRQSQSAPVAVAYELKITLEGSQPPIWRRVRVADCTLDVLHGIIQCAMGWEECHMHMFEWGKISYSLPDADIGQVDRDERRTWLSNLVKEGCKQLRYWYDFGDDWWHVIKIEKTLTPTPADRFPVCVKGAGACPPEDCGGLWGYYGLLESLRNPKDERHDELLEWLGGDFDPDHFDVNQVNESLSL
jgi:hypothetical protein